MGKKKIKPLEDLLGEAEWVDQPQKPPQKDYSFPTRARCPRCSGTDTKAYRTSGQIQYRRCRHPVCKHEFKVGASKI